ncbi:MAG: mechanosensitive ion channel family protein [Candidatus Nezhaarchaeota archaeon]|nr:mechanosensitive ion channel family protein [Candidatus Nezhaarchaeota archaeon]
MRVAINPLIDRAVRRAGASAAVSSLWKTMALVLAIVMSIAVALPQIGVRAEFLYIVVGIALLGLVLGSREVIANVIAGYVLLTNKPFKRGDSIVIGEVSGIVRDIGAVYTQVASDHGMLYVPNVEFFKHVIANRQAHPLAKIVVPIRVRAAEDLSKVESIIIRAAKSTRELTIPPEPEAVVSSLGSEYDEIQLIAYVTNPKRAGHVASDIRKRIKEEFRKEGIALY